MSNVRLTQEKHHSAERCGPTWQHESMARIRTEVTDRPLDPGALIAEVSDPACGGVGVFVGTVRSSPASGASAEVQALDYEAHPELAPAAVADIARRAQEKWGLQKVVAVHRTGRCALGEPTVVVACAAPHRAEALDACRWIIDTIKTEVPIWKKELYADGSAWVGAGS